MHAQKPDKQPRPPIKTIKTTHEAGPTIRFSEIPICIRSFIFSQQKLAKPDLQYIHAHRAVDRANQTDD